MIYEYKCFGCEIIFEKSYPIGKAEDKVSCPKCDNEAKRAFTSCSFILKGGGWPSKKASFNKEMTERNEQAGRRMRKEHGDGPVRTVAHDYGNGDVREVKK
jgi:putative FmdB family regulatory protein